MGRRPASPARGVTIRKYKSGREVIKLTFTYQGQQCREHLDIEPNKANLTFAEQLLSSIKLDISKGTFDYAKYFPESPRAQKDRAKTETIGERVAARLKYLEERKVLEPSSLSIRWQYLKHQIEPAFGHLLLPQLKVEHINNWIKSRSLSVTYMKMCLSILRPIVKEGMVNGEIDRDPIALVDWADLIPKKQRTKKKEKIDPLTMEEIQAILNACKTEADRMMYQFGFFAGVRLGELCVIEWGNIDWTRNQMLIDKAMAQADEAYIKSTKTDEARTIDLLPPALDALKAMRAHTELRSDYVFLHPKNNRPYSRREIYVRWKTIIKRARIRYRNPYQMRHTFASLMLSRGENMLWVAKQLGHEDLEMLKDHYAVWLDESADRGYTPVNEWSVCEKTDINAPLMHAQK